MIPIEFTGTEDLVKRITISSRDIILVHALILICTSRLAKVSRDPSRSQKLNDPFGPDAHTANPTKIIRCD